MQPLRNNERRGRIRLKTCVRRRVALDAVVADRRIQLLVRREDGVCWQAQRGKGGGVHIHDNHTAALCIRSAQRERKAIGQVGRDVVSAEKGARGHVARADRRGCAQTRCVQRERRLCIELNVHAEGYTTCQRSRKRGRIQRGAPPRVEEDEGGAPVSQAWCFCERNLRTGVAVDEAVYAWQESRAREAL